MTETAIGSGWQGRRTYRAALIACSRMGRTHALALASTPGVTLAALADVDPTSLGRLGDEVGVDLKHRHLSFEALLEAEALDFAVRGRPRCARPGEGHESKGPGTMRYAA